MQRVKELEDQVRALKAGNAAAPEETAASVPRQQPAAPPPAQAAAPGDMMHDVNAGLPGMHFRGFSDIRYSAYDRHFAPNTFSVGQFNLFITSKLSDKFSVLAEAVVEGKLGADGVFVAVLPEWVLR